MQEAAYHRNSAGTRMTTRYPRVQAGETVGGVHQLLKKHSHKFDTINYIYVTDDAGKLLGVQSLREMYRHEPDIRMDDICTKERLVTVRPDTPEARAGYLSLKHNIKAIPVVNQGGILLGIIQSDDILSILYKNTHDTIMRIAGIGKHDVMDNILTLPLRTSFRHRAPWLVIGLAGGLVTSGIIGFFEHTLETNLILAAFIPLIVYMSGALAVQTQTLIIRDMAIDNRIKKTKYAARQFCLITFISATCAALLFVTLTLLGKPASLTFVLSSSLFFAMTSSIGSGLFVPILLRHLRSDPANASGPLVTIIQDMLSIIIYFTIASLLL